MHKGNVSLPISNNRGKSTSNERGTWFFFSACGIIAAGDDSESYDTDDIEGKKIISQTSVGFLRGLSFLFARSL